ncbi:MAG: DUF1697 domain-containing protein [Syntrophomonadaceae bacterium]|nr:DUF1697 domain-containing protein [Syntrophomonadaceae bacterium]
MKYIALLRGINVAGKNKVSMKDLKNCFHKAGFPDAITYINSGNVIFSSEEKDTIKLVEKCKEIMHKEFGFPINLALIDVITLQDALDVVPPWWGNDPDSKHDAMFVIHPATAEEKIEEVGQIKPEYEKLFVYKEIIFWSAPLKTYSRTRWSKIVGTKAYQSLTIRNANTAKKLLELASALK